MVKLQIMFRKKLYIKDETSIRSKKVTMHFLLTLSICEIKDICNYIRMLANNTNFLVVSTYLS